MAAGAGLQDPQVDQPAVPAMPGIQGQPSAPGGTPTAPAPIAAQQPNAIQQGVPGQKAQIDTGPTTAPEYDPKKLAKANNALDLLNAMKPKSRTDYMDWWEKQHGDIEDRYAAMQQDLGQRPDPQRDPTKKEKFQMLMDFGISLLQHSGTNGPYGTNNGVAATGDALRDSLDREQQRKQADTNRFDQQTQMIQQQKQNDLKDIGNYGNAVREDALITNANTRTAIANANAMKPPKPGQPVTRYDAKGNQYEWDPDSENPQTGRKGVWQPSVDSNGNKLPAMQATGPRGAVKGPPARQAEVTDLVSRGMSQEDAINRVYGTGVKSTDPVKTWSNVYSVARRNGAEPDEAKTEADNMTASVHGAGALDAQRAKANRTAIPTSAPPATMVPAGKRVTMQDGSVWRNVNGVVQRVPQGQ